MKAIIYYVSRTSIQVIRGQISQTLALYLFISSQTSTGKIHHYLIITVNVTNCYTRSPYLSSQGHHTSRANRDIMHLPVRSYTFLEGHWIMMTSLEL